MRTKAEFRALREMTGITQQHLADELGVQVRSVKRWESPDAPQQAPHDAWDVLDAAMEGQKEAIEQALSIVDGIMDELGEAPKAIRLPYWASQEQYESQSTDSQWDVAGSWRMADANIRAVATVLMMDGFDIEWSDDQPIQP